MIDYEKAIEALRANLLREQGALNALQDKIYKRSCEIDGALQALGALEKNLETVEV